MIKYCHRSSCRLVFLPTSYSLQMLTQFAQQFVVVKHDNILFLFLPNCLVCFYYRNGRCYLNLFMTFWYIWLKPILTGDQHNTPILLSYMRQNCIIMSKTELLYSLFLVIMRHFFPDRSYNYDLVVIHRLFTNLQVTL